LKVEVVVAGFNGVHQQWLESVSPQSFDVLELNLEDAFIEYTRGPRRPLPDLAAH
jgi:ABC-2 type transport system ATP-binding protein